MIKSRAAVAFAPNKPLEIVEVDVAPPQKGEVLVRIVATGVCHTGWSCRRCRIYTGRIRPCIEESRDRPLRRR